MAFTLNGQEIMNQLQAQTGLSRNDLITHLTVKYVDALMFDEPGVVYRGKQFSRIMSIRVTNEAYAKLQTARVRTGKSYSDIGEALVARFGRQETNYPICSVGKRKRIKQIQFR